MLPRILCVSFVLVVATFISKPLFAQQANKTIVLSGDVKEDSYLAGGTVQSRAKVTGDLTVAGALVEIENEVSADVMAAGGTVTVRAKIGDDLRAAGSDISVSGPVGGDAIVAGSTVVLSSTAVVGGRAWLAGRRIEIYGKIGKELRAAGRHVVLAGNVAGDVSIVAETLEIYPSTVIRGNLRYRSPNEAKIRQGARISGTVTRDPAPAQKEREPNIAGMFWLGSLISFMLAATAFYLVFPSASVSAARTIVESPWKALGLGFALLAATPLLIVLLFLTVIGFWFGVVAFLLFPVLLLAGFLTGIVWLGDAVLGVMGQGRKATRAWRVLSLAVTLLALWVMVLAPIVGCLALFAVLLYGTGGLMLLVGRRYANS